MEDKEENGDESKILETLTQNAMSVRLVSPSDFLRIEQLPEESAVLENTDADTTLDSRKSISLSELISNSHKFNLKNV